MLQVNLPFVLVVAGFGANRLSIMLGADAVDNSKYPTAELGDTYSFCKHSCASVPAMNGVI